ncbi:MAG: ThuA domain-containing protein, partial [Planctomycetota bacterium]
MMTRHSTVTRAAVASVLVALAASAGLCGAPKPLAPAALEKIRAAAPAKATARPRKKRRLLVFSHSPGYKHSSIPCTAAAIRILGEKAGAYEAVLNDDISMFEPRNLRTFDAVVMNNTCGIRQLDREIFLPANLKKLPAAEQRKLRARDAALKKSFSEFVRGGGGFVGFHGATGAFSKWPEYGEMIGGYFKNHPWNQKITVKLDDPAHPLLAAFGGKPFSIKEETYVVNPPYSREKLRVLLTLDLKSVDPKKGSREDGDYALAWIKRHGQGRCFYVAFSHYDENFHNPKLLRFYLDAIQWALGDLEADATPSARSAAAPVPDDLFAKIAAYEAGQSRKPLIELESLVRKSHGNADARADLRKRLVALVGDAAATRDGRAFACIELSLIATPDDVPALARLLPEEGLHHAARSALERVPGREATAALRDALPGLKEGLLVGAVNSLGERRDPAASRALSRLLHGDDAAAAEAAVRALGRIGGPGAARFLVAAEGKLSGGAASAWTDALLCCADSRLSAGSARRSAIMYRMAAVTSMPVRVRFAALRGLVAAEPAESASAVIGALRDEDATMQKLAPRLVTEVAGEAATRAFARELPKLPPGAQASLIAALAARGDAAAGEAILKSATSDDAAVRLAALTALGKLGDASVVPVLIARAGGASGDEQRAARSALAGLRGDGIDAALLSRTTGAKPAECVEAIRALSARRAP